MTLTIEEKENKLMIYWEKVIKDYKMNPTIKNETMNKCLNELKNPEIPGELLKIWLSIFIKTIKNREISEEIKKLIIAKFFETNWLDPNSVQINFLLEVKQFLTEIINFDNNYVILSLKYILENLIPFELKFEKKEDLKDYKNLTYSWKGRKFEDFEEIEKLVDGLVDECRDYLVMSGELRIEIRVF
jgi:hypothetical protein